jgi:hypothetical protein
MNREELDRRIEAIETGYEFMLAYAAQGRETDKGAAGGRNVRDYLERMAGALDGLGTVVVQCAGAVDPQLETIGRRFFEAVATDADVACAAVKLVLARSDISSQLVDNLNASIHLRALLTDLFIADEALKAPKSRG